VIGVGHFTIVGCLESGKATWSNPCEFERLCSSETTLYWRMFSFFLLKLARVANKSALSFLLVLNLYQTLDILPLGLKCCNSLRLELMISSCSLTVQFALQQCLYDLNSNNAYMTRVCGVLYIAVASG
jgi:hypothetical protein